MDKNKTYIYRVKRPDGEWSAPAYSNRSVFLSKSAGTQCLKKSPVGSVLLEFELGEGQVVSILSVDKKVVKCPLP